MGGNSKEKMNTYVRLWGVKQTYEYVYMDDENWITDCQIT